MSNFLWAHLTQMVTWFNVISAFFVIVVVQLLLACQSSVPNHFSIEAKLGRNIYWMVLCNVYIFCLDQKSTKETRASRCQKLMFSVFVGRTFIFQPIFIVLIIFFMFHFKFSVFFMGTDFELILTFPKYKEAKNWSNTQNVDFLFKSRQTFFPLDSLWNFLHAFVIQIWPSSCSFWDNTGFVHLAPLKFLK